MSEPATQSSWKNLTWPDQREHFELPLHFTDCEAETLRLGFIPRDMDDRWFIFFEDGWLYFHRSWTGDCIYGVRLDGTPSGVRVVDAWASRDRDRYNSPGIEDETRRVADLLDFLVQLPRCGKVR